MAASVTGWFCAIWTPLASTVGKSFRAAEARPRHNSHPHEDAAMGFKLSPEQVERAHGSHDECSRDYRATHVVGVLPPRPGIQDQSPKAAELHGSVGSFGVAHRMLHPGIGRDDEIPREPRAQKHRD